MKGGIRLGYGEYEEAIREGVWCVLLFVFVCFFFYF